VSLFWKGVVVLSGFNFSKQLVVVDEEGALFSC
jgi:hypothetical protein